MLNLAYTYLRIDMELRQLWKCPDEPELYKWITSGRAYWNRKCTKDEPFVTKSHSQRGLEQYQNNREILFKNIVQFHSLDRPLCKRRQIYANKAFVLLEDHFILRF